MTSTVWLLLFSIGLPKVVVLLSKVLLKHITLEQVFGNTKLSEKVLLNLDLTSKLNLTLLKVKLNLLKLLCVCKAELISKDGLCIKMLDVPMSCLMSVVTSITILKKELKVIFTLDHLRTPGESLLQESKLWNFNLISQI